MIHTLLSNRMEDLVNPLATLLAVPVANPLTPDTIMVQHPGMEHWLSMALAAHPERRVAMNLAYPLPVAQMWALIRAILGSWRIPEQSPYAREIMTWRLYELLASDRVLNDDAFAEPNRYWQHQSKRQQTLRRFELAEQLADLFEQYLMYRPDWIERWDQGDEAHWQAQLWRLLTEAEPDHPVRLLRDAESRIARPEEPLPERLFIFGINSLAPLWLDFIKGLSERGGVDFHIFCLKPSDEYWGDLASEKQAARQRAQWMEHPEDEGGLALDVGNPLIASLGQQGQTFVHQLMERADIETPGFAHPMAESDSLLHRLQADILELADSREQPSGEADGSIDVVSAHSALREVQGLHDWLLHQFNNDPTLKPRDVLVMCPNVEDYAPFVEAVFARRFDDLPETVPPLPSSIADRALRDADPTVAAFLDLLSLPDARFQVNQVIGWLQVPAIRARLDLSSDDIEQIAHWLEAASIHWGLDAGQKAEWTGGDGNDHYTWAQGLKRLLLGFAWGDEEAIVGNRLLLPQVEGGDAVILGKLMAFIHELRSLARDLRQPRTVGDWQAFLHQRLRQALFAADSEFEPAHDDLRSCIREFSEHAHQAGFTGEVSLPVVRHVIENSLASPMRTRRQFITGQITVCSMIPMRSIPFRVIAVLGLNDGDFPRQRPPLGFDLMAEEGPRPGDRSRRGDDRYLFLEALLSARDRLYLSYQGRDVRTNTERQPSLVLSELLNYLEGRSGWSREDIRELPLQPFSEANYTGDYPGFDEHWLRLGETREPRHNCVALEEPEWPERLSVEDMVRALENPARHFARNRLKLYLDQSGQPSLEDSEPFQTNHLDRYKLQHSVIDSVLTGNTGIIEQTRQRFYLSGDAPDHPLVDEELDDWQEQAERFAHHLRDENAQSVTSEPLSVEIDGITLEGELPRTPDGTALIWRLASLKAKDYLRLWLNHLLANSVEATTTRGLYRAKQIHQLARVTFPAMDTSDALGHLRQWLDLWRRSLCEPLPCHADLGIAMADEKYHAGKFGALWHDDYNRRGVGLDPYMAWFWPEGPEHDPLYEMIAPLYSRIFETMETEDLSLEVAHE